MIADASEDGPIVDPDHECAVVGCVHVDELGPAPTPEQWDRLVAEPGPVTARALARPWPPDTYEAAHRRPPSALERWTTAQHIDRARYIRSRFARPPDIPQ